GRVHWAKEGAVTPDEGQHVMALLHKLINK
ncbi:YtfJ family protein, partial [Escherichia coli O2:H6]